MTSMIKTHVFFDFTVRYDANFDGQIDYREFLEAFASGRDGQGMLRKGARSLRPGS